MGFGFVGRVAGGEYYVCAFYGFLCYLTFDGAYLDVASGVSKVSILVFCKFGSFGFVF